MPKLRQSYKMTQESFLMSDGRLCGMAEAMRFQSYRPQLDQTSLTRTPDLPDHALEVCA
jgi:hypothetical protein